jgi:queuosine precursor transporter
MVQDAENKLEMNISRQDKNSPYRFFDLVMAFFVTVLIVSNIASSAKIINLGLVLVGVPLAFDGGTILFPLSYVFGDILTEVYGYKRSRRVIWVGFACLLLTTFILWMVRILPGDASWEEYAGQQAYNSILGGISTGGIVLASLLAYWAGEFSNSIVLAKMKVRSAGKRLWTRTIGSTIVGQAVDTTVFILVATLAGVFPWELFASLVLTNYILKVGVEVLMTPLTYLTVNKLKKAEQEDYYDRDTDFNPFKS